MRDTYNNFSALSEKEQEGKDYSVSARKIAKARYAIVAPHGGSIEPGTSEIANAIAGNSFSFATFQGTKPEKNGTLHITSCNFDEPRCLDVIHTADCVIAIHGERSDDLAVFTGGLNEALGQKIGRSLEAHGFNVSKHRNAELQGAAQANICNQGISGAGVQLEISKGLRRVLFRSLDPKGREQTTDAFQKFVAAIQMALN